MSDDQSKPDLPSFLAGMVKFHGQALEALKTDKLDDQRIRAELSTLHQAVGVLSSVLSTKAAPNPQQQHEWRLELTKVRGTHLYEAARESERAVIELALLGLRSLILVNGGALIALLTFIGNFPAFPRATTFLWYAFTAYVVGLFLSLGAVVMAYFAQSAVSAQSDAGADKIHFHEYKDHPDITRSMSDAETKHMKVAETCRNIAIATALASAVAFAAGSGFGVQALTSVGSSATPQADQSSRTK